MTLAVVHSLGGSRVRSPLELEDFEQELVDQFALAASAVGCTDRHVAGDRSVIFEFSRYLGRALWEAGPEDADRFLAGSAGNWAWPGRRCTAKPGP